MLFLSGAHPKRGAWNVALDFSEVGSRSKRAKKNLARPQCSHSQQAPKFLKTCFENQPQQHSYPLVPSCKRLLLIVLQMKFLHRIWTSLCTRALLFGCPRSSRSSACILAWRRQAGCNARLTANGRPGLGSGHVACSQQQPL